MNRNDVIEMLLEYNNWRRGGDGEQPDPKEVGEVIDRAIDLIKSQEHGRIELQDVSVATRHRVQLHGDTLYISVVSVDGVPVEVFTNAPTEWRHNIERMSFLESLNRQVSISLRYGVSAGEVAKQLVKGSADGQYPALLAAILTPPM